jgi:hypothetical protein
MFLSALKYTRSSGSVCVFCPLSLSLSVSLRVSLSLCGDKGLQRQQTIGGRKGSKVTDLKAYGKDRTPEPMAALHILKTAIHGE